MSAQVVAITVTDVHEAPTFDEDAPTTIWVTENDTTNQLRTTKADADGTDDNLPEDAYVAPDNDNPVGGTVVDTITYALADNDDDEFFSIVEATGILTVATDHSPDYEKQSSYSLTIVATSGEGDRCRRTSSLDITVNVVDAEDPGEVSLSQREPQVGQTVIATVTDPDGGITVLEWEWARVDVDGDGDCPATFTTTATDIIEDASSAAYTPVLADRDKCLQARVTYTDNIPGDGEADPGIDQDDVTGNDNEDGVYASETTEKDVQVSDPANTAPLFPRPGSEHGWKPV